MKQSDMTKVIKRLIQLDLTSSGYRVALSMLFKKDPIDRYYIQGLLKCKQQQASRVIAELTTKNVIAECGKIEHSNGKLYNIVVVEPDVDGQMTLDDFDV